MPYEFGDGSDDGWGDGHGSGSGVGSGSGDGSGIGSGYGSGDGSGRGWGSGSGSGNGYGSGDGSGSGYGSDSDEERLKIEYNILKNIPDSKLPLYMDIWEFDEVRAKFNERLKGESHV